MHEHLKRRRVGLLNVDDVDSDSDLPLQLTLKPRQLCGYNISNSDYTQQTENKLTILPGLFFVLKKTKT